MPKAVIEDKFARQVHRVKHPDSEEWVEETYPAHFVQVGWDKQVGDVSIATREGGDFASPDERRGFFVHLDRAGINRLIRELRAARDAAYGRDE